MSRCTNQPLQFVPFDATLGAWMSLQMASQVEVEYTVQRGSRGTQTVTLAPPIDQDSEIHILRIQFFWDTLLPLVIHSNISKDGRAVCTFWFRKLTTDPHILSRVNMECLDDWLIFTKLIASD